MFLLTGRKAIDTEDEQSESSGQSEVTKPFCRALTGCGGKLCLSGWPAPASLLGHLIRYGTTFLSPAKVFTVGQTTSANFPILFI